ARRADLDHQGLQFAQARRPPSGLPSCRQCHEPARPLTSRCRPGNDRQIAFGQPHRTPELARRHVDQHQVHGPAAKPVFRLCRSPGRQRNFMAVVTAHPRAMHGNLATMENNISSPSLCSMATKQAVRQKRSKELSTSCQAVSRLGMSASDEGVVIVVMALLSLRIRHPEPNGSRWATPPSLIQQRPGQSRSKALDSRLQYCCRNVTPSSSYLFTFHVLDEICRSKSLWNRRQDPSLRTIV